MAGWEFPEPSDACAIFSGVRAKLEQKLYGSLVEYPLERALPDPQTLRGRSTLSHYCCSSHT